MSGPPVWEVVPSAVVVLGLGVVVAVLDAAVPDGSPMAVGRRMGRPMAEVARLLRQRRRRTRAPDALLWHVGLAGPLVAALLMGVALPLLGRPAADLPAGVVWLNAVDIVLWAVLWLAGWGPNSVDGLVGGYRFLAQALAYELPLMFALTTPAVAAGSLRVSDVVAAQSGLWYVVWMPVAFAVTLLGVVGFSVWGPLSPAAAPDLAGGVLAELCGPDRLLVSAGRYLLLTAGSAFATALFLGGTQGPLLPGWVWMSLKTLVVVVALVAVRGRLALLRPDRFLEVGWLVLLPLALVQLLVVSLVVAS